MMSVKGHNLKSVCVCVITRYPAGCTCLGVVTVQTNMQIEAKRRGAKLVVLGFVTLVALMLTSVTQLVFFSLYLCGPLGVHTLQQQDLLDVTDSVRRCG